MANSQERSPVAEKESYRLKTVLLDKKEQVFYLSPHPEMEGRVFELPFTSPREFAEHLRWLLRLQDKYNRCPTQFLGAIAGLAANASSHSQREAAKHLLNWIWLAMRFAPESGKRRWFSWRRQPCRQPECWFTVKEVRKYVVQNPLIKVAFTDYCINFTVYPDSPEEYTIPLLREPTAFLEGFHAWWNADEEAMRIIIGEIWKFIHPQNQEANLSPEQRYELATLFIEALSHEQLKFLRSENEDISWHYCIWHKLRWEIATGLPDEAKQECAAVEWLTVCHRTEPTEPAMAAEIDPECEIRDVLFGDKNDSSKKSDALPHFLERRERERRTLTRLAHWFMRRYDLNSAFRIISPYFRRLFGFLHSFSLLGMLLFILVLMLSISIKLASACVDEILILVLFGVPFIAALGLCGNYRLVQLVGRLIGGCVIGWLPLFTEELWRLARSQWIYVLTPIVIGAAGSYVFIEARRFLPESAVKLGTILKRIATVTLLGLCISGMIGFLACCLGVFAVLPGVLSGKNGEVPNVFPWSVWFLHTPLALFIGIFIQILWEEKPMTEPL